MRFLILSITLLFLSCSDSGEVRAKKSLDIILQNDLSEITADVDTLHILEEPRYEITELEHFKKSQYSYNAVVDFYFLRDKSFKIERKFRYNLGQGKWERYHNEYKTIKD